ncbi:unnamed protein product [Camellia sinensis]
MKVCSTMQAFHYFLCSFFGLLLLLQIARAQNGTTPASEVIALNSIFKKWAIVAASNQWNISGEPCTGAAIDGTSIENSNVNYNPGIQCECNGTICHITHLKVYALDVIGVIPDELWTLTHLINLNLAQNYLTGPLSASIGNLTRMQYLSLGTNALSGELPVELGKLTNLISLSVSSNNFSGPLPSDLGNLAKLEQLYIDSSGLSGAIPSSFASLQNMKTVWASDTELNGSIPDFIGNWSKLTTLEISGKRIWKCDPIDIFQLNLVDRFENNLKHLDLSFNNLTGQIPDALFLGNNKLTGTLPAQMSTSLLNIDLSYNELSGSFPSWISKQGLQLNLVANNFTVESSNNSVLPSGLRCLQRNFPCYRNSPVSATIPGFLSIEESELLLKKSVKLAVDARDKFWDAKNRISGHGYNRALVAASIGSDGERSSEHEDLLRRSNCFAGTLLDARGGMNRRRYNIVVRLRRRKLRVMKMKKQRKKSFCKPEYRSFSSSQFTKTLDSELFQTARISAGSLRYYGLGLENGNYSVSLQFAEMAILTSKTWKSVGRRVFDIYIQGNRVLKDFDIRKEAGGASFQAVQKDFTVRVSENYLEIHLFWAGKGTCCIPTQATYGPSISAISATPADFIPTVSNNPPTPTSKSKSGLIVGIVVPVAVVTFLSAFMLYCFVQRRKRAHRNEEEALLGIDARPYTFSYAELRAATEDFNPTNKLGEGGFGPVYKGTLNDGRVVAVKQLSVASHQGKGQFVTEIATISAVQHRNLVKLYGCCIEGDKRLLVYEYLENKSLDQALFGKKTLYLNWPTRFDICLGVARGLSYLHEESRVRIVHRDVKASNILLDSDLIPKISDFGLAKLYDDKKTHISTRVAGTIGYLAPEYAMRGHLTEKADVFGFGVVALEIVSGRLNSDSSLQDDKIYLLEWAWNLHENKHEVELVDANLSEFNEEEVKRVIGISLLCTQTSPTLRPSMSRVVAMLSGDIEVSDVTSRPGYLTDWKFNDKTSFMSDDIADTAKNDYSHYSSSTSTARMAAEKDHSPINVTNSTLEEIIGEGR